jgi:tetratricopeptide (TPR) repeat protein
VKLERYLKNADPSSAHSFLSSAAKLALDEENYAFAITLCEECLDRVLSDIRRFDVRELLIEAYIGAKRYDDAKAVCEKNLSLYPVVSKKIILRNHGSIPENMACRNRYIDVAVGIESGYDEAFKLLDRFLEMGLISGEDYRLRKQSLKIHRLQRSFDGVYTYAFKDSE